MLRLNSGYQKPALLSLASNIDSRMIVETSYRQRSIFTVQLLLASRNMMRNLNHVPTPNQDSQMPP